MMTISEAFRKFKGRLEISDEESSDASRRQQEVRERVEAGIGVETSFLTGSYIRHTKTRPLKDVDIFVVLKASESQYLHEYPDIILDRFVGILGPHYPERVSKGNRSVKIDFAVSGENDDQIVSFDVVPSFEFDGGYKIPDRRQGGWIETDPRVHAELATAANAAFDLQWKPVIKMIKKWNEHQGKPVKPSFLLEVMALDLVTPPWGGSYPREIRQFLASAASTIHLVWEDPAKLGPPVSARLAASPTELAAARAALIQGEKACTTALLLEQQGRIGASLDAWQELFGPRFAKS